MKLDNHSRLWEAMRRVILTMRSLMKPGMKPFKQQRLPTVRKENQDGLMKPLSRGDPSFKKTYAMSPPRKMLSDLE